MINKRKENIEKLIQECGYNKNDSIDIEKIMEFTIDKEPGFDLDEKIKNYAEKTKKNKKIMHWLKWSIPATVLLMIVAFVVILNLNNISVINSNEHQVIPNSKIDKIDNIDIELALLDIEIEMTQYEIEKDSFTKNNLNDSNIKIDTT